MGCSAHADMVITARAGTAPYLVSAPAGQANYTGASVSFTVTAGGDAPLLYVWT